MSKVWHYEGIPEIRDNIPFIFPSLLDEDLLIADFVGDPDEKGLLLQKNPFYL